MVSGIIDWQKANEDRLSVWLNHMIVVYAFLLPLDHPRAGYVIVWGMVFLALMRGNYRFYFTDALKHPISIAFLLFYLMHLLWNLYLVNPPILVHTFKENMEYALLVPFFMGIIDFRFVNRVVSAFLLAIMMSELFSYGMHFGWLPPEWIFHAVSLPWHSMPQDILIYSQGSFYIGEPAAFIKHSLYTAALAFCVAIMLYRLLNHELTRLYKIVLIFFMLTMTYNISIVGGRTGYFIYIILLLIVILATYKRKFLVPFAVFSTLLIMIGWSAYSTSPIFKERVEYTIKNFQNIYKNPTNFISSEGGRIGMWYYGLDVVREHPWFGVPQADFVKPVHERISYPHRNMFEKWYFMPHSFYLSTLLQFGLVGLIVLINIFVQSMRRFKSDEAAYLLRLLAVVTVGMSLIPTDPIDYFLIPFMALMVAITVVNKPYISITIRDISLRQLGVYVGIAIVAMSGALLQ